MFDRLVITNLVFSAIIFILIQNPSSASSHHIVTQISVYYESLCPDSRRFFVKQLLPTYDKLNRYMDVELVPFGKANVSYPRHDNKPVFNCQHGPAECTGNRIQSCVIEMVKNTETSLKYVKCMFEQSNWKDTLLSAQKCAEAMSLDWPKIKECHEGSEGERLLIANSLKTFNLSPELNYVPWVVIDKNHTSDMQSMAEPNLLKYLCDQFFNHEPKIQQCQQEAIEIFQQQTSGSSSVNQIDQTRVYQILTAAVISTVSGVLLRR